MGKSYFDKIFPGEYSGILTDWKNTYGYINITNPLNQPL